MLPEIRVEVRNQFCFQFLVRNAASNYTESHLMRYRRDVMDTEPNICCGSEAKMPETDKNCQKLKEFNKELTGDERDWAELMAMGVSTKI